MSLLLLWPKTREGQGIWNWEERTGLASKGQEKNKSRTRAGQEETKRGQEDKRRTKGNPRTTRGPEKDKKGVCAKLAFRGQ